MKKFFKEFKEFISKGSILDLAIGVIIGGAFSNIVNSLVKDIIMPLISLLTGGVAIEDWKWVITPADEALGIAENALHYGNFIQMIINFLIISFSIFVAFKIIRASQNKLKALAEGVAKKSVKKKKRGKEVVEEEVVEQNTAQEEVVEQTNEEVAVEAEPSNQEKLLIEIRDLLQKTIEQNNVKN